MTTTQQTEVNDSQIDYIGIENSIEIASLSIAGQNFVEDTKEYQKKEWSKEKGKIDKLKEKVLEK